MCCTVWALLHNDELAKGKMGFIWSVLICVPSTLPPLEKHTRMIKNEV